jgi:hypothetical protein
MESGTLNKDQEIAGPAAALFTDSSSPFDTIFDTKNSTFQQDNQSAAAIFDNLGEQHSQTQQTTTDYSSYYGYEHNSSTLQESTHDTVTNATSAQQYNSTAGYDYNYYGGQYAPINTNSVTEGVNSPVDSQSTATQYQYDYTGYSYDASYNGQDYSQYYDYSQQQQYYDPNVHYSYYYDPSAHNQYTQEINNSNEHNFQNYTQDSINVEQQQNLQELPDHANSNKYEQREEEKDILNNIQMNSIAEVDENTYNESKPNIEHDNVPPELSTTDIDKNDDKNDDKNLEFSPDSDKENKKISQEMEYSIRRKSIEKQDIGSTLNFKEHLSILSSNNLSSSNNEDVAAVALVETIETNRENVSSTGTENVSSIEKDGELNEDQEVNIIHRDDHDIFEYQPQELESHPKLELSHVEPPVSSLTDESKITSEISATSETEEINNKSKEEQTKLDDLDDLVLGSTSKSGTSYAELDNTQERYSISAKDNDANSSSYQYDYSGQDYQYNYGYDYQYQEYDVNQATGETTAITGYQFQVDDTSQTIRDTTNKIDHANYQYDTGQIASDLTTEKEPSTDRGDVDQYSSQTIVENSSDMYQNGYQSSGYEANQSTAVNAITEADQSNYQYQEYESGQANAKAGTDQSNYQHYQEYQPNSTSHLPQNSPPPMSPSPKGSSLISCPDPQCGGENKVTAKFCSDCGKPINNIMNSISISEMTSNTNLYSNNLNAYPRQSLPYNHSQASYSASSFASYSNHSTSVNDTQYPDTHQLDQQYYGTDDVSAINDFLGRSKGCRPIVAFGFGGKIYTMFPRTVQRFTSTDQSTPITKSAPGAFTVRVLKNIIPMSDIDDFPGPLLMDNNRGGVKAKKKSVLKYINDQIQIAENNINSFSGESEKNKLEAILIVWNLFKIMIENEGALVGRLV